MILKIKVFFVSRDVKFFEDQFPFAKNANDIVSIESNSESMCLADDGLEFNIPENPELSNFELEPTHVSSESPLTTTDHEP